MNYKLYTILLIGMFLISSLTTSSTIGDEITTSSDKNPTKSCCESEDYQKPEFWGVLVGSNPFSEKDGDWFITPTLTLYDVLLEGGWKEENIKLLTGHVTKIDIKNALNWIAENAKPIDTVFIYLMDHGLENNFCVSSDILSFSRLWYRQLNRWVDKIDCAGMAIMISACQSGTAIKWLKDYKRVILTSCDIDEHRGFNDLSIEMGLKGFADIHEEIGNRNGYISIEELYEYCIKERYPNPDYPGYPRIQDDYDGQLSLTFHNWSGEKVDQIPRHASNSNYRLWVGKNEEYQVAQSFVPNDSNLTKVQLLIENANLLVPYQITMTIRKDLHGDNLTSETITPVELTNRSTKYLTFDFPDIQITPGEKYFIVCNSNAPLVDPWSSYEWHATYQNSYDFGCCYKSYDGGKTWNIDRDSDALFILYSKEDESENHRPYTPLRPVGPVTGKKNHDYNFYVLAKDHENDLSYYMFDWDDGNHSEWLGPYNSGDVGCASHNWTKKGSYHIRVISKDQNNSGWDWSSCSDTLRIDIARSKLDIKLEEFFDEYRGFYEIFHEILGWNIGH